MKKAIFIFLSIVLTTQAYSQGQSLDRIIALVNDQMVMESDLYDNLEDTMTQPEKCSKLHDLIIKNLLYSKALKDSIIIQDEEIESELNRRLEYFISVFGSVEKMEKYYKKPLNDLKIMFRDDLKIKLLSDRAEIKLLQGMEPTPREVKDYFNSLPPDSVKYYNSEMELGQLVFLPKISRSAKRKAKNKLEKIKEDIMSGESTFSTQAILYSADIGTATNGGDLGWISQGQMVPEFENAAFNTPKGKFSEIVESQYGYHLIEVLDKTKTKVHVRHILITPKADDDGMTEAKHLADSVRQLLLDSSITFSKAVELYSDDQIYKSNGGVLINLETRSPVFEIKDVDPTLVETVNNMNKGDITEPMPYMTMDRKVGYRIVKILDETLPHKASLETDYYRIKEEVYKTMKEKALKDWLAYYKNYVFIQLNGSYNQCYKIKELTLKE